MMHKNRFIQEFDNIDIPEKVDSIVMNAIRRGEKDKKLNKVKNSLSAFILAFALFALSVNTIPAFAVQFDNIPILSIFVDLVKLDRGLTGAVNDGLTNKISKATIDNNVELMIDSIVSDNKYITINYTLKGTVPSTSNKVYWIFDYEIKDGNGSELVKYKNGAVVPGDYKLEPLGWNETTKHGAETDKATTGRILSFKWNTSNGKLPEKLVLECSSLAEVIREDGNIEFIEIPGHWEITIPISLNKTVNPIVFPLTEVKTNYGIFKIESVEIHPIRVEVKVSSEKQLDFDLNFYLIDDAGNTYVMNSYTAEGNCDFTAEIDSCYYSDYNSLYLVADGIDILESTKMEEIFRIKLK